MQISGTYFDRLLAVWMPLGCAMLIFIAVMSQTIDVRMVAICTAPVIFFWAIDSMCLFFMALKPLSISDAIYIDKKKFSPNDILHITPVKRRIGRIDYNTIDFAVTRDGKSEKISIMAKPVSYIGLFRGEKSKTYALLFEAFPQTEQKMRAEITR